MQRIVRQSKLPIKVSFSTPRPLSLLFRRPATTPCPNPCYCGNNNRCFKKNVVYRITCQLCQQFYIGETGGALWTRAQQHLSTQGSSVFQHFRSSHGVKPKITDIGIKILSSGFETAEHRRSMESNLISKLKPQINSQLRF